MDITDVANFSPPTQKSSPVGLANTATAGGIKTASPGSQAVSSNVSGADAPAANKAISADALQQAMKKLSAQIPAESSVTLEAGLDADGGHPGQVLIKLSDKVTKQTFYQYYVPAEQVVKSAESGTALSPGSVMSTKA